MSEQGEDIKTEIPELKIEVTDPSNLSYTDKLRRFGESLLAAGSTSLVPPPSPTPQDLRKMADGWKAQLAIKEDSIEKEFAALEKSLSDENATAAQIEEDIHFLTSQVREAQILHTKILEILVKDATKTEECNSLEEKMVALNRRLYRKDKQSQDKLKELKPRGQREDADEEDGGSKSKASFQAEASIAIQAQQELTNGMDILDDELKAASMDPTEVRKNLDIMGFLFTEFERANIAYRDALTRAGKTDLIQPEIDTARRQFRNKVILESAARAVLEVSPTTQTVVVNGLGEQQDFKNLPQLSNNVKEWLPFWAIFKETDTNRNLSQLQKFRRLIQATKDGSEARDIVVSYSMSPSNYTTALARLKEIYGRDNMLVKVYVRELLQIAIDRSLGKQVEFRKLVNEVTAHMRNLEILGVTQDKCAAILYPVIEACLPKKTLENWQGKNQGKTDDLGELLKFLRREVDNENERKLAHFHFTDQKPRDNRGGRFNAKPKEGAGGKRGLTPTAAGFHNSEEKGGCVFCDGRHPSTECRKALKMTFEDKQAKIKERNVCFMCFKVGHMSRKCRDREKVKCDTCGKNHQTVLCPNLHPPQNERKEENLVNRTTTTGRATSPTPSHSANEHEQRQSQQQSHSSSTSSFSNFMETSEVPLQMLLVRVEGAEGKTKIVKAMLDTGSQKSYVTTALSNEMGFSKVGEETVIHQLFGGASTPPQTHMRVKLHVAGPQGEAPCNFDVSCIPRIAESTGTPPTGKWIEEFMRKGIIFPRFPESRREVDVLIGNDVAPKLYLNHTVDLLNGPVAIQTRWGWVLGGKIPVCRPKNDELISNVNVTTTLNNLSITQLWDLDLIGIRDNPATQSAAELAKQTEEHFVRNVARDPEGRYQVKLPFLTGAMSNLPSNFYAAERRLRTTTDNLRKSNYLDKYDSLFQQWEEEGMIDTVDTERETEWKETGHYLPHRAVIKLTSATTPVRPVFDASAKSKGRPSLNMCLDAGPNYLELIPSILTRFRLRKIGVTADIRKAFQQISVAADHRPFLRFLWWRDYNACKELKLYQHSRVVFGVNCSPFLLAATLQHHLSQSPATHKTTADKLKKSLYVDNCFESLSSMEEALHFQKQSIELLQPAKFDLREWSIGPTGNEEKIPALGMIWDMGRDLLSVGVEAALEKAGSQPTQRNVLALAHSLFDPLGIISPFILPAKLILRKCHEEKLGWDKPLPKYLEDEYDKWRKQISLVAEIRIPRHTYLDRSKVSSLHTFSDASGEAYAAAVFLRCETLEGIKVTLLQSKARIATKAMKITIPRLELIGCLIGVRLAAAVVEDIGDASLPITYYTDSSTALAWIQGEGPWGIFVENRVKEIREKTTVEQWRHVRGKDNPADLPSRGCTARKLLESEWWSGPSWLYKPKVDWPVCVHVTPDPDAVAQEKKRMIAVNIAIPETPHSIDNFLRASDYSKILRMLCYWRRYVKVLRARVCGSSPAPLSIGQGRNLTNITLPTLAETEEAERVILQHIQKDLGSKQLRKLRPFTTEGIMRTSTPIFHDQDYNFVYPVILPEKNEFVQRILRSIHERGCHMGTQLLLAKAREKFWVINGRKVCRGVVGKCWICRRHNSRRVEVPEVSLPRARTETGVPFSVIGVDMAGPLIPKKGEKVWMALFTCATYRAIHLELVDNMSTDEFLNAFRAFACRRGKPKIVYSDNGLNFVGANAALQKIYQLETARFATERAIEWRHNPPNAPWIGGFFERLIGLVKCLVRKVLGKRVVTKKELRGLLLEVEEIINNRPLTYMSESPDDPVPLTPNMMIRNTGLSCFPELDIRDASHARAAFKRIQRLREMLRTSFRARYLGALSNKRVGGVFYPLQPGDIVLLEQDNEKRVNWPLGVIVEAIPGRDKFPRTYLVKTKLGLVQRAAQKLYPMELQESQGCATGVVQRENHERTAPMSTTAEEPERDIN